MVSRDRRFGVRVPVKLFLDQYVDDQRFRVLTVDISETGVYVHRVATAANNGMRDVVAMELNLPGTDESIWARGEICHESGDDICRGTGIRFTGLAKTHARMIRDYCVESRRSHLGELLHRIRKAA